MWPALLTPFLLCSAFLLLLLVSLSVPIIKTLWFFGVTANVSSSLLNSGASADVHFGLWGYCVSAVDVSVVGFSTSGTAAQCSQTKLGYTFDSTLSSLLGIDGLEDTISHALTAVLVLHPIACGLVFLALLPALFMCIRRREGRGALISMVTMVLTLLATLLTLIIFIVDCVLVSVVHDKIKDATDGVLTVQWGDAVWMVLGALIALLLAVFGACAGMCACCGSHRTRLGSSKQVETARY